ncbi:MAG TPA: geranylgeranylglycerol-phosphate geranylgeranyltransferase [Bacteroidales bacterium]|nr:geranylgeranylglycerol-phosphate geranylgeranyltransferase [Bacteroidales bacterium]HPT02824.1 geranylgeranylglycerol-phosphate geranylgeranyltransferase [Bacteroidales bacterium]
MMQPRLSTIFRLIRLPNLIVIALTLSAVRYLVILPGLAGLSISPGISPVAFGLIVFTTLTIAAAGYILNDCYDIETDMINRPERRVIGKDISRKSGLLVAVVLFTIALLMGLTVSVLIRSALPFLVFLIAVIVAWWYAIMLKRTFLLGNLAVACMTACTIGMIWLFDWLAAGSEILKGSDTRFITIIVTATMVFAWQLNLMREIVKDMEDVKGDERLMCRSLPIVLGMQASKNMLAWQAILTISLLLASQAWLCMNKFYFVSVWLLLSVELPLAWFVFRIGRTTSGKGFHRLSSMIRWIMLGGLLSLLVLRLNAAL